MRHYEIVLIINPEKSEKITQIIEFYKNFIIKKNGKIHRFEDWGRRSLAYPIKKYQKAHYLLFNIELKILKIKELEEHFKFNENILRNFILVVKKSITEMSHMLKNQEEIKKRVKNPI
ncbi:30S ribosomal protein S6 [Buchnera aphidicola]|uniref:Small ribosomal subunit protein bS6 n=1 Tax=Buchnera aphidicola subsp. Tuberolachnus salignus TaxID=98804 RepID=A0A160SX91_BUCTT|nr:30S ribosomal protein S6 [Buchnera aphidicola]CUR53348.1 30S ribosomal protein S6 [Buchnera aphidicola (Tuberolachnus salignus)]